MAESEIPIIINFIKMKIFIKMKFLYKRDNKYCFKQIKYDYKLNSYPYSLKRKSKV